MGFYADSNLHVEFAMSWAYTSLVHAVAAPVNLHVKLSGCAQKTLLPCSQPLSLVLTLLLPPPTVILEP